MHIIYITYSGVPVNIARRRLLTDTYTQIFFGLEVTSQANLIDLNNTLTAVTPTDVFTAFPYGSQFTKGGTSVVPSLPQAQAPAQSPISPELGTVLIVLIGSLVFIAFLFLHTDEWLRRDKPRFVFVVKHSE